MVIMKRGKDSMKGARVPKVWGLRLGIEGFEFRVQGTWFRL